MAATEAVETVTDLLGFVAVGMEWGWVAALAAAAAWTCLQANLKEFELLMNVARGVFLRWMAGVAVDSAVFAGVAWVFELRAAMHFAQAAVTKICRAVVATLHEDVAGIASAIAAIVPLAGEQPIRMNLRTGVVELFQLPLREREWHLEDVEAVAPLAFGLTECCICKEMSELSRTLPCKHYFCAPCVDRWLMLHGTCPMCRGNALTAR